MNLAVPLYVSESGPSLTFTWPSISSPSTEVTLAPGSPAAGTELARLGMPREAVVVAVVRRAHVVVPRGDTILEPGDEVLVLVSPDSEDAVRSLLVADAGPAAGWLGPTAPARTLPGA